MSLPALVSLAPLPPSGAPYPYHPWRSGRGAQSESTAFSTGLDTRDRIPRIGPVCVLCGERLTRHTHIIPKSNKRLWHELCARGYVPPEARPFEREPRNGLTLCPNHHKQFEAHEAFVRYMPEMNAYIWFEFPWILIEDDESSMTSIRGDFHGTKLYLDPSHARAPIYSLFLIHEEAARAHHPFERTIGQDVDLHEVQYSEGIQSAISRSTMPSTSNSALVVSSSSPNPSGAGVPGMLVLSSLEDARNDILACAQNSESWRQLTRESLSFDGTAEENIEKYRESVGFTDR
ncbi:hypothetical protein FB45DRAFT_925973 [Roridomyces roridus]|uniref:HNH nuclease domain-containing protein n=1 Tax=Roridomyces roridus TaxID=1738132 RepID=A0AAD7FJC9_9AGAR|nr:hypothetical protein FB45DRAFT_925973 [Roridomyces roridus]